MYHVVECLTPMFSFHPFLFFTLATQLYLQTWKQPGLPPRRSHFPQEDTTLSTVPRHGSHHHLPSTTSVQEALSPDWWKGQAKL